MRVQSLLTSALTGLLFVALGATSVEIASAVPSSTSPYAGQEQRKIKALSPEELRGLEAGEGMGLAKAAELNHYPGPRHVLDLSGPLELSDAQRTQAERIFADMHAEAVVLGSKILALERELDGRFASQAISEAELARLTELLGKLNGELRDSHLRAHLLMRAVLTPVQLDRYQYLRGYDG